VAGEHTGALPAAAEAALALLMERAAMLDGRVSNGEQVQVDLLNPVYREHLDRVAALWKRVLLGLAARRAARRRVPIPRRAGPAGLRDPGGRRTRDLRPLGAAEGDPRPRGGSGTGGRRNGHSVPQIAAA
jgi:hypothetical protein